MLDNGPGAAHDGDEADAPDAAVSMVVGDPSARHAALPARDRRPAHHAARWPTRPVTRRVVVVAAAGLVLTVVGGISLWPGRDPLPAREPVGAPTEPVGLRWSMEVAANRPADVVIVPGDDEDGADLLVRDAASDGRDVLARRDGATGVVEWSVELPVGQLVVALQDGGAAERALVGPSRAPPTATAPTAIDAVTLADGSIAWTRTADRDTSMVRLADGGLAVAGGRSCAVLDGETGAPRVTFAAEVDTCVPRDHGLVWFDGRDWVLLDGHGAILARAPVDLAGLLDPTRRPRLVGDLVIVLDPSPSTADQDPGRDPTTIVRARLRSGDVAWEAELDGRWLRADALGTDHVVVTGPGGRAVLTVDSGRSVGTFPANLVTVAGRDGFVGLVGPVAAPSVLEAAGVWSRSPDATEMGLVDLAGDVLGTQSLVVTSTPVPTADGILVGFGPDGERRIGLFSPTDLSPTWDVTTELRFGQVVATSTELVVVEGDADGTRRLDVLGP